MLLRLLFLNDQNTFVISPSHFLLIYVLTSISCSRIWLVVDFLRHKLCEISAQICNLNKWAPVTFKFPPDNIRKTFTVMHNPVFEHANLLSFALLACIMLFVNGTQFMRSVFNFVQYISLALPISASYSLHVYHIAYWISYL